MPEPEKIRISLDDVNSREVDRQLHQQAAVARTTAHYQQQVAPSMPSMAGRRGSASIWYNTLVYMTLFGFLGGMVAWPVCEIVQQTTKGPAEAFLQFLVKGDEIINSANAGEISETEAELRLDRLTESYQGNEFVALLTNESLSDAEKTLRVEQLREEQETIDFVGTILFCCAGGMVIAVFLCIADSVVSKNLRQAVINGSVGLCLGMLGGLVVGLFINKLYQAMGGGSAESGVAVQVAARAIGWAILGLFLAVAPGIVMKSPKKLFIGLAGGFLGGLIGGVLFDVVVWTIGVDWLSRLAGLVAIGAIAGLGTGLIENAAKTGWMRVVSGLIAGKQFILYKNPTIIGSSPQCEIYLFKDTQVAPQHAAIRKIPQGYELQDLKSHGGTFVNGAPINRVRLKNNDEIQIAGTTFLFQEKDKSHAL